MANFKSDPAHGFKGGSRSGVSHVVGGAPGFRSGSSKMPRDDAAAGFHGRGTAAVSHNNAASASGGPKKPKKKL